MQKGDVAMKLAVVSCVLALMAVACAGAQQLTALPPQVVVVTPEPFATNVDPLVEEVTVTFDRPMDPDGFGFGGVRWTGLFPGIRNAIPSWRDDNTTCVLPVSLVKDCTYAISVNDTQNRGFVDANGVPACGFAWVFATGERTAEQLPPHVVSSAPEQGATDVDPRLREITVSFDRLIAPGDHSWVIFQGSGLYPGYRGGEVTLSEDRMSAALDVRLSPGTVYALGVNDLRYSGYKDIYGRPLLPFGLCFRTAD